MIVVIIAEVVLLLGMCALIGFSLNSHRQRRVIGRWTLLSLMVLSIALALARGQVLGLFDQAVWIQILGTLGVGSFVACISWELSDARAYEYWLINVARQAVQSLAIPFFSFAWMAYHLIYLPLSSGEVDTNARTILIASGVILPVSVAYIMLWQLLPTWVSKIGAVMTTTSALATVVVVNLNSSWGLVISLLGTAYMTGFAIYVVRAKGLEHWMSQPPIARGRSVFVLAIFALLLVCSPIVSLYARESTPQWVTVLVLMATLTGAAVLLSDASRSRYRERQTFDLVEHDLQQIEYIDPLTKIANRVGFQEALMVSLAEAGDSTIAVYHIDLGGFRAVNDAVGSFLGDEVLTIVADRLANQIRAEDTLARLGGDEFGVLLHDCPDGPTALTLAENLHTAISHPIELGIGWRVNLDSAIGVVLATSQDRMNDVMRFADAALHRAKNDGEHAVSMIGVEDLRASVAAFANDQRLRTAFIQHQFTLMVQPVIDLSDGATVGFEALARWPGATLGPAEFIPLIEENGLADAFGTWVLQTATKWAAEQGCEIAVNISPRHMHSPNFVRDVLDALNDSGLPGELLLLEITERSAMPEMERTNAILNALRERGIRIAVDDFGTGEFSLQQLMEYPLDVLKIDRTFVSGIDTNHADKTLVTSLVHVARGLTFTTIAEGVEDETIRDGLFDLGCTQAQGYLWSPPMSLEKGAQWWKTHKRA